MDQTNTGTAGNSNSDRRVDSSRWRADAEAADEQARQRAAQARQEQDEGQLDPPEVVPAAPLRQPEIAKAEAAEAATDPLWQRWWEIQSNFVDDPRSSVAEAHALISGVVDRALQQLQEQRSTLEQSWSSGTDSSTEDLRRALHAYRDFLGRLLSGPGKARA